MNNAGMDGYYIEPERDAGLGLPPVVRDALRREGEASRRLDGETQAIEGPVHIGTWNVSDQVAPMKLPPRAPIELQIMLPPRAEWDITDYRELLRKYIKHVTWHRHHLLEDAYRQSSDTDFTDDEWATLLQVAADDD